MILELKKDQLKAAIADIAPMAKRVDKTLPVMRRARVAYRKGALWLEGTDRFIALRTLIAPISMEQGEGWEDFELSVESLELLAKLSPTKIEVTPEGVTVLSGTGNVKLEKINDGTSLPAIEKMIDENWDKPYEEWGINGEIEEPVGFRPDLIKHIKDVVVVPRRVNSNKPARLVTKQGNRIEGIIMPVRMPVESLDVVFE